ncbi:hypothetical protein D3C79_713690 [compost metagenome]
MAGIDTDDLLLAQPGNRVALIYDHANTVLGDQSMHKVLLIGFEVPRHHAKHGSAAAHIHDAACTSARLHLDANARMLLLIGLGQLADQWRDSAGTDDADTYRLISLRFRVCLAIAAGQAEQRPQHPQRRHSNVPGCPGSCFHFVPQPLP